jgi:hypothetical protein
MTTLNEKNARLPAVILPAVLTGGLLAGIIDAASAFHAFGWNMPYGIASGLLGAKANPAAGAGPAIWALGLALHFFIALLVAAIYCNASRWLDFLPKHFIMGGVVCGIGTFLTMNLVVLPLSAVPFPIGPFTVKALRNAMVMQPLLIGLPISTSFWFFARRSARVTAAIRTRLG